MINLLDKYNSKYHLQLGEYTFSPLIRLTAGISLDYCEFIKDNVGNNEPFIFCFPEKKAAALWTSLTILTNYYLEDYINTGDNGVELHIGNKVSIYGCIAEIEGFDEGSVVIKFRDQGGITLNDRLKPQLSVVPQSRSLNNLKKYQKARLEVQENRNPISKILEPFSNIVINEKHLTSKVLLVAGRGQVKVFHKFLETVEIYGEKLGKVFPEGQNLIITADLKKFKSEINPVDAINESNFIKLLNKALKLPKFNDVTETIQALLDLYNEKNEISEDFDVLFHDLINDALEEIPELKILKEKYPGISQSVKNDFRAVIINDIQQLSDYPNTIKAFLNSGIPVIVFSDRKVTGIEDIHTFQSLFQQRPHSYRLNWNKKKIISLISYLEDLNNIATPENENENYNFIDHSLWKQAVRYGNQSIHISTYQGNLLDTAIPGLLKEIRHLDEFEILQKSFYNNLYPAIFALKNSKSLSQSVLELITRFESELKNVVNQIPEDLLNNLHKILSFFRSREDNFKDIEYTEATFSTNVPLDFDKSFTIPVGINRINHPTNNTEHIIFTGYPFKEQSEKFLINSICEYFVPNIEVKCWPKEAELTYNYIYRRIKGGYFFDNLPFIENIDDSLMLKAESDIQNEIQSYLIVNEDIEEEDYEVESNLQSVNQYKYKGYQSSSGISANWKVNCDILNFEDGSFMFLKKGSNLLCLTEGLNSRSKVVKKNSDQFFNGDIIFRYIKDRSALVEISKKNKQVSESYKELDYWREVLNELLLSNNNSVHTLETFLTQIKEKLNLKGNPAYYNLSRWLFDDEVISPDEDNLELILKAAEVPNIEDRLLTLKRAYRIATAHRISLSTRIKKEIAHKISKMHNLDDSFKIKLDGSFIEVETRTISTIDKNGVLVDYHNTRKILC